VSAPAPDPDLDLDLDGSIRDREPRQRHNLTYPHDHPATITPDRLAQSEARMPKLILALTVVCLAAAAAAAQEVYVDYDRSGRFSWYTTYAWADGGETSLEGTNDLLHSKITNAIETNLARGRLVEVDEHPNLYLTYHAGSRRAIKVDPVAFGFGTSGSWVQNPYWGGVGVTTASARTYEQGTLVIDFWEAETNKLVWRGVAIDVFFDDPDKTAKKLDKAIKKMIKKWRKMKPGL
jgi:hypothetical protein